LSGFEPFAGDAGHRRVVDVQHEQFVAQRFVTSGPWRLRKSLLAVGPRRRERAELYRSGADRDDMKQAIVARADLGMGEGKLAAQVAHASLSALEEADDGARSEWKGEGQKKVVLQADGEAELFELAERAGAEGVPHAVVRDAGHTQLDPGTVTALAVGPAADDRVDAVTGHLSLY
jgi:PTH2 family peptidyl-tRNA hydrolase